MKARSRRCSPNRDLEGSSKNPEYSISAHRLSSISLATSTTASQPTSKATLFWRPRKQLALSIEPLRRAACRSTMTKSHRSPPASLLSNGTSPISGRHQLTRPRSAGELTVPIRARHLLLSCRRVCAHMLIRASRDRLSACELLPSGVQCPKHLVVLASGQCGLEVEIGWREGGRALSCQSLSRLPHSIEKGLHKTRTCSTVAIRRYSFGGLNWLASRVGNQMASKSRGSHFWSFASGGALAN